MKSILQIIFSAILFFAGSSAFGQTRKSVREHRQRLPKVAVNFVLIYADKFPSAFKSIHILEEFMEQMHDVVKVMSVKELEYFHYEWSQDVVTRLAVYDSLNVNDMPEWMREEFEHFKEEFNRIENERKAEFFSERGISVTSNLAMEIRVVETIVDLTDTGLYRRKEMGIKSDKPYNGADYLLNRGFPKLWADLSRVLEDNYDEFLQPSFIPVPRVRWGTSVDSCRTVYAGGVN